MMWPKKHPLLLLSPSQPPPHRHLLDLSLIAPHPHSQMVPGLQLEARFAALSASDQKRYTNIGGGDEGVKEAECCLWGHCEDVKQQCRVNTKPWLEKQAIDQQNQAMA